MTLVWCSSRYALCWLRCDQLLRLFHHLPECVPVGDVGGGGGQLMLTMLWHGLGWVVFETGLSEEHCTRHMKEVT